MKLPTRAWMLVLVAVIGGAATVTVSVIEASRSWNLTPDQMAVWAVFGAGLVMAWLWPLVIYRGVHSEAVHLDEGCLVVMALLLPPTATVAAFLAATVVAQAIRRRSLVKSVFNVGQVLTSVGIALAVGRLFIHSTGRITAAAAGGAALAACLYFLVNSAALAAILTATGSPWRSAVLDGIEIRLVLLSAGIPVALVTAMGVRLNTWAVPLGLVSFVVLRQVLSGHFKARHDRSRLHGLFDATLEASRHMGPDEVQAVIIDAARNLLRCPEARFVDVAPGHGLSAELVVNDTVQWITVSGRSRTEPFDGADRALLEALAAVGATALTNSRLYQEGRFQRRRLAAITSSLGEGVCALSGGILTFINPAAAEMLGWDAAGLDDGGRALDRAGGTPAPGFLLLPAARAIESGARVTSYDTQFQRADGSLFHVAYTASPIAGQDGPTGAVIVFRDITERKLFEEQLSRHAFHDALTGLANRRLFLDHLNHALRRSERSRERHAVLFVDVDRFKLINDGLGHQAGDQLLVAIASRIQASLRPGDVLARFGGDEFTVLLEGVTGEVDAVAAARRITQRMADPIMLPEGHEVVATVSIGIAVTSPGQSHDDVLRDADVAMYQAKRRGVGRFEVFDGEQMGVRSSDRIDLEAALRRALDRDEIVVYFQPLFSTSDGNLVGAEALVRWRHPERGLLSPAEFVPVAEESGLILPLGRHVLKEACHQARRWREMFGADLMISVNLSGSQFDQAGLGEEVRAVLADTHVDPHQICLEITEGVAMDDLGKTAKVLRGLKDLGVRVAIDDFGTGYSSLAYLKSFPVDVVKIDRCFVEGIEHDHVNSAIVSAVIGLSDAIGATTVVEGVETEGQLSRLCALGCPLVQGFHLARPMPAAQLQGLLQEAFDTGRLVIDCTELPRLPAMDLGPQPALRVVR